MDQADQNFQCAVIGGGLAGLCLSIQLADRGISVVLFEKNQYPFHKVCGEYISMESWDFLTTLGLPLADLELPLIRELGISSEKGFMLNHQLKMGGFGISRFSLDYYLSKIATAKGVRIIENCRVNKVEGPADAAQLISTNLGVFQAEIVCGSYGKYAPAFIQKHSDYISENKTGAGNYIGVKYHIKTDLPSNRIELHNFRGGYCGVSKVDRDWYCLCYLTNAGNLHENGKDLRRMERNVLHKNPFLKKYFLESEFVKTEPLVISNVQFSKKQTHAANIFLLGDAAGSITPLCGNGMSMAMRASKLLAEQLISYFEKRQLREAVVSNYQNSWNEAFSTRITSGFYLQHLFGKKHTTDYALKFLNQFPSLTSRLIALTHGSKF